MTSIGHQLFVHRCASTLILRLLTGYLVENKSHLNHGRFSPILAASKYRAVIGGDGLSVFLAASLRLNYQDMHMGNLAAAVALCSKTLSIISSYVYAPLVLQVP